MPAEPGHEPPGRSSLDVPTFEYYDCFGNGSSLEKVGDMATAEQDERTVLVQTKGSPEEIKLIDLAATIMSKPRNHFTIDAAVVVARKILDDHNITWPPEAA